MLLQRLVKQTAVAENVRQEAVEARLLLLREDDPTMIHQEFRSPPAVVHALDFNMSSYSCRATDFHTMT